MLLHSEGRFQKLALTAAMAAAVFMLYCHFTYKPPLVECGPYEEPRQTRLSAGVELTAPEGYRIDALAEYEVEALVVSARSYTSGREADLSPVDLALAWGELTSQPALDAIRYSQSGRWYYYRWANNESLPVKPGAIAENSANTHLIVPPDRDDLRETLLGIRRGATVRISGYLVQVTAEDGWKWVSSRSRTDTGVGSCEVLYVSDVVVH